MKLRKQLYREKSSTKRELGDFCYQFEYDPIIRQSRKKTSQ